MEHNFYVYGYLRTEDSENGPTGSFYYIGKGKDNRATHRVRGDTKPNSDLSNIVIVRDGMTEEDAFHLESTLIAMLGRLDAGTGLLRNRTDGGDGISGHTHSLETRNKIRAGHLGKRMSRSTRAKLSASCKGRKNSPESTAKTAAGNRGKSRPISAVEKTASANRGRKNTPESIERMRIAARRRFAAFQEVA